MFTNTKRSYTVAFPVRSGSNAICDLLTRDNLGAPSEWFQQPPSAQKGKARIDAFAARFQSTSASTIFYRLTVGCGIPGPTLPSVTESIDRRTDSFE